MPVENERKFTLLLNTPEHEFADISDLEEIEQAYLIVQKKQSARIRKTISNNKESFSFTFKQDIGKKTIEIETLISSRDYDLLKKESILKLNKHRYKVDGWEIDFFKENGTTYFVQAEIELPENKSEPDTIHFLVKKYLFHVVDKGDGRFSSKKLGNVKHARRLMQFLMEIYD
jgi:CYTH domain-containing protein